MKQNVVHRCLVFKLCFAALAAERHAQSQPQGPGACTSRDASGACTAGDDAGQLMTDEQAGTRMERRHGVRGYACPEPDPQKLRSVITKLFGEQDGSSSPIWMPNSPEKIKVLEIIDHKKDTIWITLAGLEMGDASFLELAPLLPLAPMTTVLTLNDNNLTDDSVPWLCEVIPHMPNLAKLNLRGNVGITAVSVPMIAEAIRLQEGNLQVDVVGTSIGPEARSHARFEAARFLGVQTKGEREAKSEFFAKRQKTFEGYDERGNILPGPIYMQPGVPDYDDSDQSDHSLEL